MLDVWLVHNVAKVRRHVEKVKGLRRSDNLFFLVAPIILIASCTKVEGFLVVVWRRVLLILVAILGLVLFDH